MSGVIISNFEGKIINDRYLVHGEIGHGAMGEVYRVTDLRLDREAALKILRSLFTDDKVIRARFEREARAAGRLSHHPNVVTVFDVNETNGQPFLVMEYVNGGTLSERLRGGAIPCDLAVSITLQVLSALSFAHSNGILHRDIKPSNILLTSEGVVKVGDFGIATIIETAEEQDLTRTSGVIGTPAYLSPERAEGRKDITPASDVFSVGVVLYEMVTGRKPFKADSPIAAVIAAKAGDFAPALKINPTVDKHLSDVISRSLAASPENRYSSAAHMAAALDPNYLDEATRLIDLAGAASFVGGNFPDDAAMQTQVMHAGVAANFEESTVVDSHDRGAVFAFAPLVVGYLAQVKGFLVQKYELLKLRVPSRTRAVLGLLLLAVIGFFFVNLLLSNGGQTNKVQLPPSTSIVTTTTSSTSTVATTTTTSPTTLPPVIGPGAKTPPGLGKKGH